MKEAFLPNRVVDKHLTEYIFGGWIILAILVWLAHPSVFLPSPGGVWDALVNLWVWQGLGNALMASLWLNLESIGIAAVISLGLAYLSTIPVFEPAVVFVGKLRFLSLIGLSFAFVLIVGSGTALKVSVLVFAVTVFFVVGMLDVIASIPKEQYDLARTLKMGDWQTLWEVVILGQIDQAFVVLRQNAAMSWLVITVAESMVRSGGGIGTLLVDSNRHFNLDEIFAIQSLFLGLGMAQDYGIGVLRNLCCPYADLARGR